MATYILLLAIGSIVGWLAHKSYVRFLYKSIVQAKRRIRGTTTRRRR